MSAAIKTKTNTVKNKIQKEKQKNRYFVETIDEDEVKKCLPKAKGKQNFDGEIIQVDQIVAKPFRNVYKAKKHLEKLGGIKTQYMKNVKNVKNVKKEKIPKALLAKHTRGECVETEGVKTKYFKEKQQRKEIYLQYATEQAARTELLHKENSGFLEADDGEITAEYRQEDIVKNVDIQSAAKQFKLNLDCGPYRLRYTSNGRHLLLGGRAGHVAAFDWITKKVLCEFNVMEEIVDISWLHMQSMFAVAQKNWVFIYDNQGTELHCIKRMYHVNRIEYLPYFFLLAAANADGYLTWVDVSMGTIAGNYNTRLGDIRLMRNNPTNGVICVGGGNGVVSMWSPKVRQPLAKLVCHKTPMSALTVDTKGQHLITAGYDRKVKIWDIRALDKPLAAYELRLPASHVEVSQRGVLAYAQGTYIEMQSNLLIGKQNDGTPYLRQTNNSLVHCMRFCPYEDVLGVATANGFHSLLVPGAGEPNFDAYEDNPYQNRTQRREQIIQKLLEKVPAEFISLDPNNIANVDEPTLQEKIDAKRQLFHLKPPQIDFKSRHKMKGRGGSAKAARNKQIVKDLKRKEFIADIRKTKKEIIKQHKVENADNEDFIPLETETTPAVLQRFKSKRKIN